MNNSAELVAHYTTLRVACEHVLPESRIRFSPLTDMNDPRENKQRMIGVGWSGNEDPSAKESVASSGQLEKAYREYSKVFCGTLDAENPHELNTKRCFGRPRMWAQYGENHRGVCFLFHKAKLDREIRASVDRDAALFTGAVVYDDYLKQVSAAVSDLDYDFVREDGLEATIRGQVDRYHKALFFRKDSDWIGESEYRWIIHRWELGYEYVEFSDSLEAIVVGCDCPDVYMPTILKNAQGKTVRQLRWDATEEDYYFR